MSSGNLARNIAPGPQAAVFAMERLLRLAAGSRRADAPHGKRVHGRLWHQYFPRPPAFLKRSRILRNTRLDLAVCDFDMPCAADLGLLQPASRWRGVSIGLMPTPALITPATSASRSACQKPVSVDMLVRSLKASYTNMAQQRIAAYQAYVAGEISFRDARASWLAAHAAAGERAQCKPDRPLPECRRALPHGAAISMKLMLPESSASLHASGNVVWSHTSGRAGIALIVRTWPGNAKDSRNN